MLKGLIALFFLVSFQALSVECPKNSSGIHLKRKYYELSFSREHKIPEWTCHVLEPQMLNYPSDRSSPFKEDPMLPHLSALPSDYKGSGYDRGHMVPVADMSFNEMAASETFFMSNITPQEADFNRGIWLRAEEKMRSLVKTYGSALIVSGVVLDYRLKKIEPAGISIPQSFYKIIYYNNTVISYLIPNRGSNNSLESFRTRQKGNNDYLGQFQISLEGLEVLTGLDFADPKIKN